jgi:hypothetical protein
MLGSFWAESFRTAPNRSRFIAQKETRNKIIKGLEALNKYTCRTQLTKLWACGIKPPQGFLGLIQDALK